MAGTWELTTPYRQALLPLYILRGDGIYFDNRHLGKVGSDVPLPDFLTISHGRVVTLYPIAPALVAVPFFAPQVAVLDLYRPGWDRDRRVALAESLLMAKRSMAVVVALAGVVLHRLLLALGLGRAALPAVLAACLGSDLWTVGSQAPWQHGPAALSLIAAIALLHPQPVGRLRLALAGAFTALLVACRLDGRRIRRGHRGLAGVDGSARTSLVPAGAHPGRGGSARLQPLVLRLDPGWAGQARAISHENTRRVGHMVRQPRRRAAREPWSARIEDCSSSARGSPWRSSTLVVPAVRRRLSAHSLICVLIASLIPYLIILSKYSVWWGGHCFGPRYWTDVIPLFAILFAYGLDWMLARSRVLVAISAATVIFSIAVQLIGAFCYPSSWNLQPRNVDLHHERLWDWRDTELSRSLIETFKSRAR